MGKTKTAIVKELRKLRDALRVEKASLRELHIETLPLNTREKLSMQKNHERNIKKLEAEIQERIKKLQSLKK